MRLFVAVFPPEEIVNEVEEIKKSLAELPMRAKFVEKQNLHISLSFLGERKESELEVIKNMLSEYFKKWKKFEVLIDGIKLIPNQNYFRVIALDVPTKEIDVIGREISSLLKGDFKSGHLTLCRVKDVYDKQKIRNFASSVNYGKTFIIEKIDLVQSRLTRQGPVYSVLESFFL